MMNIVISQATQAIASYHDDVFSITYKNNALLLSNLAWPKQTTQLALQ